MRELFVSAGYIEPREQAKTLTVRIRRVPWFVPGLGTGLLVKFGVNQ